MRDRPTQPLPTPVGARLTRDASLRHRSAMPGRGSRHRARGTP
jgi:hypothetical protein